MTAKKKRTTKMRKRTRTKRSKLHWRGGIGTDLSVTYKGPIRYDKDLAIRKALGEYDTGSGYSFFTEVGERDFSATVPDCPPKLFVKVVEALKKIRGITIKKRIQKWVRL